MRLFVAVDIGDECRQTLSKAVSNLETTAADVKWVATENMHITLKFLGAFDQDPKTVIAALGGLNQKKYMAEARGLGALPNISRPRIIYAGIGLGGTELEETAKQVEIALEPLGFAMEQRAFLPHITLGRVKSPKGSKKLAEKLLEQKSEIFGKISVGRFQLMKSDLGPKGPVYSKITDFPLM